MVTRRSFIAAGIAAGATLGAAPTAGASATGPVVMYQLRASWSQPIGPSGKTRCRSRACHAHAANKVFASAADAVAHRAHAGCVAPAVAVGLPAGIARDLVALRGPGEPPLDLRNPQVRGVLINRTGSAVLPAVPLAESDGGTPTADEPAGAAEPPGPEPRDPGSVPTAVAGVGAGAGGHRPPRLAFTGAPIGVELGLAAAGLVSGAAALRARRAGEVRRSTGASAMGRPISEDALS